MSTEMGTTEFGIPMQTGIPEAQLATDGSDSPAPEEAAPPAGSGDDPQRRHRTVVTQLEQRIRDITPMLSVDESPSRGRRASQELVPDPSVLVDLEAHARSIASNVDMVLRDLRGQFLVLGYLWDGWNKADNPCPATVKGTFLALQNRPWNCPVVKHNK